mgnify:FL=1
MSIETTPQAPHTTIIPPEEKAVPDHEDTKYVNVFDLCQDVDIKAYSTGNAQSIEAAKTTLSNLGILTEVVSWTEQRIIARSIAKEAGQEFASDRVGLDNAYDALRNYEHSEKPQDQLYALVDTQMREILSSTRTDEERREKLHDLTNLLLDCKGRIQHTLDELSKKTHNDSENDPIEPRTDWNLIEAPAHVL